MIGRTVWDRGARGGRMGLVIGIDTGGTFTDCVVIDGGGRIVTAKASSTPGDFSEGVMESLRLAGEKLGLTTEALLRDTEIAAPIPLDEMQRTFDWLKSWGMLDRTAS